MSSFRAALLLFVLPWGHRALLAAAERAGLRLPSTTAPIALALVGADLRAKGFFFWLGGGLLTLEVLCATIVAAYAAAALLTKQPILVASSPLVTAVRRGDGFRWTLSRGAPFAFAAMTVVDTRGKAPRHLAVASVMAPLVVLTCLLGGVATMIVGADRGEAIDHRFVVPIGALTTCAAAAFALSTSTRAPSVFALLRGQREPMLRMRVAAVASGCVSVGAAGISLAEWRALAAGERTPGWCTLFHSFALAASGDLEEARKHLRAIVASRGDGEHDARLHLAASSALDDADVDAARAWAERLEGAYRALADATIAIAEGQIERAAEELRTFEERVAQAPDPTQLRSGCEGIVEAARSRIASTYRGGDLRE